jgi:predicted nucleic acid-binding protein
MRFWDTSALVTLFVAQPSSADLRRLYAGDDQVLAWELTDVELRSALCRLEREHALTLAALHEAVARIEDFWTSVHVVSLAQPVKECAKRLLGVHQLRAADALQLAAALTAVAQRPQGWEFVCLDQRLGEAALREGFTVVP